MDQLTLDLNKWKDRIIRADGWKPLQPHRLNAVLEAERAEPIGAGR